MAVEDSFEFDKLKMTVANSKWLQQTEIAVEDSSPHSHLMNLYLLEKYK